MDSHCYFSPSLLACWVVRQRGNRFWLESVALAKQVEIWHIHQRVLECIQTNMIIISKFILKQNGCHHNNSKGALGLFHLFRFTV